VIGLIGSCFWTAYALYIWLVELFVPNALGVLLTGFQIIIWGYYYNYNKNKQLKEPLFDPESQDTENGEEKIGQKETP
jgi:hypothetical protein